MKGLNEQMLEAHAEDDRDALIGLYAQAAGEAADIDTKCFFLTHAYVFALEAADPRTRDLRKQLVSHGREPAD
ncbi:hypothetical protein [Sulfitobacter sp.]|uniref:hypothetical protein n=1 Tax=Sulfitobacter sp. TaxID=1903071 RepID=UPI003003357F